MIKVVSVNSREMDRELKRLSANLDNHSKNESRRALASVINKNLSKIKTKIVRKVSAETQIPQKAIRPRVKIVKAKATNLNARVWVGLNRITAKSAGAKPSGDGYSVGPYSWKNAFSSAKLNGGIYERKGRARLPIKSAGFGEGFTSSSLKKVTNAVISKNLNTDFKAQLFRELSYRLDKVIGKR
jgi:hypothetical protein